MKRTTTRRGREIRHFVADNRRLFPFAGLFALGAAAGVAVYIAAAGYIPADLLHLPPLSSEGWLQAFGNSCFATVLSLAALFLFGLWGCGAPFILSVPLFHGLGLGLTEAYYYSCGMGGVGVVAVAVMPVGLLTAAVLAAAGAQSLRMSVGLCRHLLGGDGDDPRRDFRLYCIRFLLFLAAAIAVSLIDILLRGLVIPA
ncbi:MAG: stage II sporulation protein M [Clostridia bacterium]|nr:stage II sporulation protein M [Clostridia bacterium]